MINDAIHKYYEDVMESVQHIHYVDPNLFYDEYCEYIKKNDARKTACLFLLNLFKHLRTTAATTTTTTVVDVVSSEHVLNMICSFQEIILTYIHAPDRVNEVNELQDRLFIIVTTIHSEIRDESRWRDDILPKIEMLATYKAKDFLSLSSRAIFKSMDIVDFLKKQK